MVDAISSLAAIDYRHDEWGVDVTVGGSQKGLMLPPGLSFNAMSPKASKPARPPNCPRATGDGTRCWRNNARGFFPYTPATNLLYGLREALTMLQEEGLPNVFRRHDRLAEATRRAVRAGTWRSGPQIPPNTAARSPRVLLPEGFSEAAFRAVVLDRFNMSLGAGLGKVAGKVFRIGHLGDFNELMLAGTLAGVEMGLELAGVPHRKGGINAALDYLTEQAKRRRSETDVMMPRSRAGLSRKPLGATHRHGVVHRHAVQHAIWLDAVRQPHAQRDPLGDGGDPACLQHSDLPEYVAGAAGRLGGGPLRPAVCGDAGRAWRPGLRGS